MYKYFVAGIVRLTHSKKRGRGGKAKGPKQLESALNITRAVNTIGNVTMSVNDAT